MKHLVFTLLLTSFLICQSAYAQIRILPLGDSITAGVLSGSSDAGGYRNQLLNQLANDGYNIDYLGTLSFPNVPSLADSDHEGHSGFRIDQLDAQLAEWANTYPEPDAVLLMAGTNDFSQGSTTVEAFTRMESLVENVFILFPNTDLFLGFITPRTDAVGLENSQVAFNQRLNEIVTAQTLAGNRIHLVDTRVGLDATSLNDGIHPLPAGYDQLGTNWFNGITPFLAPSGDLLPPVISSALGGDDLSSVVLTFSKPIDPTTVTASNFTLDGGLSVLSATLGTDERTVTLTTTAQPDSSLFNLTVSNITDQSPSARPIAPGTSVPFSSRIIENGGFEDGFTNWTPSGNVALTSLAFEGIQGIAFNGGNSSPNGVVSQDISTIPGQVYTVNFDYGLLTFSNATQQLEVSATGNNFIGSQTFSIQRDNLENIRFLPGEFRFMAESAITTLTFADASSTTNALDLLLDNVRVTALPTQILTVTSTPQTGVPIDIEFEGQAATITETTNFALGFGEGESVTLTAPLNTGNLAFVRWEIDGAFATNSNELDILVTSSALVEAIYIQGAPIIIQQPEDSLFAEGGTLTLEVDAIGDTPLTYQWRRNETPIPGATSALLTIANITTADSGTYDVIVSNSIASRASNAVNVTVLGFGSLPNGSFENGLTGYTVSGNVELLNSPSAPEGGSLLTFNSGNTTPNGVVSVVVPAIPGQTLTLSFDYGTFSFPRSTMTLGVNVQGENLLLDSSVSMQGLGGGQFDFDSAVFSFVADSDAITITFTDLSTSTVGIDLLLDNLVLSSSIGQEMILNGSFEFGYNGWIESGGQVLTDLPPYQPTDGSTLLVFNGGNVLPNNGQVFQEVATVSGRTYNIEFDYGTLGFNTNLQSLNVNATGNTTLLNETLTAAGNGQGTQETFTANFNFVADSESTIITFRDNSTTNFNIDLVLDRIVLQAVGTVDSIENTSFEQGLIGWLPFGNLEARSGASSGATDGNSLLAFNGGNSQPNGILQQDLSVIPGQAYALTLDVGTVSFATQQSQTLGIEIFGGSSLLNDSVTVTPTGNGVGGFVTESFNWTADGETVTLILSDLSEATNNLDLLVDNLQLETDFAFESFVNGSFELDFIGWQAQGNQIVTDQAPFTATDGDFVNVFNGGNTTPNGVLEQSIRVTEGVNYSIRFDYGALGFNNATQTVRAQVTGASILVDETFSISGDSSGSAVFLPATVNFTADSDLITFTFADESASTSNIDLLLDNVEITANISVGPLANGSFETGLSDYTTSGNVSLVGPPVYPTTDGSLLVAFNAGQSTPNGVIEQTIPTEIGTSYLVEYDVGIFTFSNASQSLLFEAIGGQTLASEVTTISSQGVNISTFETVTASFIADSTSTTLRFSDVSSTSNNLDLLLDRISVTEQTSFTLDLDVTGLGGSSAQIAISPADLTNTNLAITPANLVYFPNTAVEFTTPLLVGGATFQGWLQDGIEISTNTTLNIIVTDNSQITAVYQSGVPLIVTEPQSLQINEGTTANFSVTTNPASGVSFQWQFNGSDIPGANQSTLTLNNVDPSNEGSYEVFVTDAVGTGRSQIATLQVNAFGEVRNGSFEEDFEQWQVTGNTFIFGQQAVDGSNVASFNAGNSTPNGTLSQVIATVPGQTYQLDFEMGVLAFNTSNQSLFIEAAGNTSLLSEFRTLQGVQGSTIWESVTLEFTADSATTTLFFQDVSSTTNSIDLLLDFVRITPVQ